MLSSVSKALFSWQNKSKIVLSKIYYRGMFMSFNSDWEDFYTISLNDEDLVDYISVNIYKLHI